MLQWRTHRASLGSVEPRRRAPCTEPGTRMSRQRVEPEKMNVSCLLGLIRIFSGFAFAWILIRAGKELLLRFVIRLIV